MFHFNYYYSINCCEIEVNFKLGQKICLVTTTFLGQQEGLPSCILSCLNKLVFRVQVS
jgi:hypothetical protein